MGPADEIGAANRITPASVKAAAALVTEGKTYNFGIVVDSSTPAFSPRSMSLTVLQPNQIESHGLGHKLTGWATSVSTTRITMALKPVTLPKPTV